MADGGNPAYGRIAPADVDAVVFHALAYLTLAVVRSDDDEAALTLLRRALPRISAAMRMQPIGLAAQAVLDAEARRGQSGEGSVLWCGAILRAKRVLARDAMAQAMKRVDA